MSARQPTKHRDDEQLVTSVYLLGMLDSSVPACLFVSPGPGEGSPEAGGARRGRASEGPNQRAPGEEPSAGDREPVPEGADPGLLHNQVKRRLEEAAALRPPQPSSNQISTIIHPRVHHLGFSLFEPVDTSQAH